MEAQYIYESNGLTLLEARVLFRLASRRLLDVNNWHKVYGEPSTRFSLLTKDGDPVEGPAASGNYFNLPVSQKGSMESNNTLYAEFESIRRSVDKLTDEESISIKVRATPKPGNAYKLQMTPPSANFILHRKGTVISAFLVAFTDFTKMHWKNLTVGLMNHVSIS
ncbi:hypothetical protein [Flavihumibacter sp.]|uniref:hypothetical protein n=1 Tax=Flavihumibacter sp. TaxID=1913981 RepID=UPI002FC75E85|nr:hypothetical protein [Flavihumibacter sediminis]